MFHLLVNITLQYFSSDLGMVTEINGKNCACWKQSLAYSVLLQVHLILCHTFTTGSLNGLMSTMRMIELANG